jgi:predicted ATPase/class 3 adenylate cyclase
MECPNCKAAVPDAAKFCAECGAPVPRACSACGHASPPGAKFCPECGASITNKKIAEPALLARTSAASSPERRQLTVMFCDMVGSSALSTQLDPEEHREVVASFQVACASEIKRLDGMVAQFLGDGVLAYFGYPVAHEDDAERAVRAGLAIVDRIGIAATGVELQARVGVASGVVVVGDLVRGGVTQQNAAIGETTNLAARLQTIAEPNAVVISPATHRLVRGFFEYRDLGYHPLKGFAGPVHVHQVIGQSTVESRFEAQHPAPSPLLGRDEELELLVRRWEQAKRGEGRVVLVTGEPGIGKSRLVRALRDRLAPEAHTRVSYFCGPTFQDSVLYPFIGQLTRAAGIERTDTNEEKLDKLEGLLTLAGAKIEHDMPFLAALLSIPAGDRCPLPDLAPQKLKERTLSVLLDLMKRLASRQPLLMVFEDLHWIDLTSLELLSLVINQVEDQPVLLVATARPEFTAPWPGYPHISTVPLNRLGRADVHALVETVTEGKALPPEVLEQIMRRTDGVPLFVEELTKTVLESGVLRYTGESYELAGTLLPPAIPSTLHASLLARLDRLATVKDVAQIGSAIGREFSYGLLSAVAALPDAALQAALTQLVNAELLYQRGWPPHARYQFKHALVQDAAYASMVRSRRQQLHTAIGRALEQNFPEVVDTQPETLAHHFTEGDSPGLALSYWLSAGRNALSRSAFNDAINQLKRGLALLGYSDVAGRNKLELDFLIALRLALSATKGFSAPETRDANFRALSLLGSGGTVEQEMAVMQQAWNAHHGSAEHDLALDMAQQYLILATRHGHADAIRNAHRGIGLTLFIRGDLTEARSHLENSIQLSDMHGAHSRMIHANDDKTIALSFLSWTLWLLGYSQQSITAASAALARARQMENSFSVGMALHSHVRLATFGADPVWATTFAEEMIAHCNDNHLTNYGNWALFHHGYLLSLRGDPVQGLRAMSSSMEREGPGAGLYRPQHLGMIAAVKVSLGRIEECLALIDDAVLLAEQTNEGFFEAELRRLRGEFLVQLGRLDDGEADYHTSLKVARMQGSRWWELKTATSLARLWRNQGKRSEAREILAPVHDWFTEGVELADLRAAKTLLD